MSVYSAIQDIAKQQNISIYRIEKDLGFPNGIIGKWNHSVPGAAKLQVVADYLGVTSAYILNKSKDQEAV